MRYRFLDIDTAATAGTLLDDEVHIWSASLERMPEIELLARSEQERAARFKVERIRNQFVVGRGLLRSLLGGYLGLPAVEVPITYEAGGKPVLDSAFAGWHFNVSHSEAVAVFAFSRNGRIGIDIERQRPIPDAGSYVERYFTDAERTAFAALPAELRQDAFLRGWVCKEAVLKALGRGITSLDCCDVDLRPDAPPRLLRLDDDVNADRRWSLTMWEPAAGFLGALAVEQNM